MIKLASALPKGTSNGLGVIARDLVRHPTRTRVVLAIVDCQELKTDTDTGDTTPVMRIRRIEAITGEDAYQARRLLERAMELRTGDTVLPFEVEEELSEAFGNALNDQ